MSVRVLSAKVPEELVAALDETAAANGVTRNRLVRDALEAVIAGDVAIPDFQERRRREFRAGMRREREIL